MLKFIYSGIIYIVCMKNLIDKFRLRLNLGNICYTCNTFNLSEKVTSMTTISLTRQIC